MTVQTQQTDQTDSQPAPADRRFIFTVTTGRSGTMFLSELLALNLRDAEVHHEQRAYHDWGVNCPDVSHMTTYNLIGNNAYLRQFWQQKFARIKTGKTQYFTETSHTLAKAGLIENLGVLNDAGTAHVIYLKRDIADTAISFTHRADFCTKGNMWLWYLVPNYANVMIKAEPLIGFGQIGLAIWYIIEMQARAEYYRLLLANQPRIVFHEWDMKDLTKAESAAPLLADIGTVLQPDRVAMPGKVNANVVGTDLDDATKQYIRNIVSGLRFDAAEVASTWHRQGRELGPLI